MNTGNDDNKKKKTIRMTDRSGKVLLYDKKTLRDIEENIRKKKENTQKDTSEKKSAQESVNVDELNKAIVTENNGNESDNKHNIETDQAANNAENSQKLTKRTPSNNDTKKNLEEDNKKQLKEQLGSATNNIFVDIKQSSDGVQSKGKKENLPNTKDDDSSEPPFGYLKTENKKPDNKKNDIGEDPNQKKQSIDDIVADAIMEDEEKKLLSQKTNEYEDKETEKKQKKDENDNKESINAKSKNEIKDTSKKHLNEHDSGDIPNSETLEAQEENKDSNRSNNLQNSQNTAGILQNQNIQNSEKRVQIDESKVTDVIISPENTGTISQTGMTPDGRTEHHSPKEITETKNEKTITKDSETDKEGSKEIEKQKEKEKQDKDAVIKEIVKKERVSENKNQFLAAGLIPCPVSSEKKITPLVDDLNIENDNIFDPDMSFDSEQLDHDSELANLRRNADIAYEGPIWKKRYFCSCLWHVRHFVLLNDGTIKYFGNKNLPSKNTMKIYTLRDIRRLDELNKSHSFRIILKSLDREDILAFDSEGVRNRWAVKFSQVNRRLL